MDSERELVAALGNRFIERRDVKAVQMEENPHDHQVKAWQPIWKPWTMDDFRAHLEGTRTFGHYMVSPEGNAKLFAFDIDLAEDGVCVPDETDVPIPWNPREAYKSDNPIVKAYLIRELRAVAEGIAERVHRLMGIPVAICNSGNKGLHVYGFTGSATAGEQREAALGILKWFECWEPTKGENFFRHVHRKDGILSDVTIEVFPKQDTLASKDRLGNLMALPLGVNRVTGVRKEFIRASSLDPTRDVLVPMDPMRALSGDLPWE